MDWFLYDIGLHHERVNICDVFRNSFSYGIQFQDQCWPFGLRIAVQGNNFLIAFLVKYDDLNVHVASLM